jgi:hypothetical protein
MALLFTQDMAFDGVNLLVIETIIQHLLSLQEVFATSEFGSGRDREWEILIAVEEE